jgi:hypothetical protein
MSRPSATFTIDCAGCGKSVTHPYDGAETFEFRIEQLISKEGWVRRDFAPNARLWFCDSLCAYHSPAAVQCEEWWRKHNQPKAFSTTKVLIATLVTMVLTVLASFGLQHLIGR